MTEFLLATTLMWVTPKGQTLSESMNMAYPTHTACVQALTNRIETMRRMWGVSPVAAGGEMCVPHEKQKVDPGVKDIADRAAAAAAAAAAKIK